MTTNPSNVAALRAELKSRALDGFIVPLTDEHMSEYVGAYAERLAWLTGFGGSAGNAAVLGEKAAIFVDGRYTLQVKDQVDEAIFEHHHFQEYPLLKWVADNAGADAKIGYDPELATVAWKKTATAALAKVGAELVAVNTNPVDAVWHERPQEPMNAVEIHDDKYAGRSAANKRADVAKVLKQEGADAAVISMLDSVAWAFNIRSKDVLNTPVAHAYGVLRADESATLFVNPEKVDDTVRAALGNQVSIEPRSAFYAHLTEIGNDGKSVLVDRATNNAKIFKTLEDAGASLIEGQDPCVLPKAIKNEVEQQGTRDAHIRDGAAITEFLHWLSIEAPKGTVDELSAVAKLWSFREARDLIRDWSFDTIAGAGPNGAVVHYRVNEKSSRKLELNTLFLVDSGGQYLDGTTDITRTIAIGKPSDEMCENFTRVLKGHIALATTNFPEGTSGMALDTIARRPLWDVGLDYDHGTGHGVGSYLAVHEGPHCIAKGNSDVPLEPGMILSIEPGYYKANEYGIRIENLVMVQSANVRADSTIYKFEVLTHAPIDRRLIKVGILNQIELDWINDYHREVFIKLRALVDPKTRNWLKKATAPLQPQ